MNHDPFLRLLGRLPRAESDAVRAERVRMRCHAALARQRVRRVPERPVTTRLWESAVVVGLCVVYLAQVIRQVLHLYGVR